MKTLRMRLGGPWSLRRRLVLGVVALLAVLAVVIGVTSVAVLNDQLVRRLDVQLTGAADRSGGRVDTGGAAGGGGGPQLDPCSGGVAPLVSFLARGQGQGAIAALSCNGGASYLVSGHLDANGDSIALTSAQQSALVRVRAGVTPSTVSLPGLGDYRAVERQLPSGAVIINALSLSNVQATTAQLSVIVAVVTLLALALAVALGLIVVGVALRPLTRVAATATRVSELPLEDDASVAQRVPEGDAQPATEVGRVGQALNRLLDRVESALQARSASEAKLRRFVADASHELRTPLASIRGYSELSRRYDDELPDDVRHSLDRIGSESVRMTALVEDLLLLARLDSGSPIVHEPVDLGRVLVDAVSDAHAAAPDHEWALELPGDADEPEVAPDEHIPEDEPADAVHVSEADEPRETLVLGDARSLHQVAANLLANARTHTPSGTQVTVTLREDDDDAVIEVADNGPGIPAGVRETLFERFVRGDDSRSRIAGSTGLGLSIAQAIVRAHDGDIGVESEPGRTVFRVRLPLDPYVEPGPELGRDREPVIA